jgi:PAS domain S-box-containing protein
MNVLVVDDNGTNRKLLRLSLQSAGVEVYEAADGIEALALLQRVRVDAIISDILMPRMDGYQLCREVRASREFCDIPFIVYTATYTSDGDEMLAGDLGADRFLRKPASADALVSIVNEVTAHRVHRGPRANVQKPEVELMKEYSARLVAKLEEKQFALEQRSEELRNAHEQLQRVVTHSPAVIYTLKIDGQTLAPTFVSDNIRRLSGLSVEEVTTYAWWEQSLHPDDRSRVLATLAKGLTEGGYSMEYRVRHQDGTYRWVEDRNRMLLDAAGRSGESFGVWTDITERKAAEETTRRLVEIVESSNDAIFGETLDGIVTTWNPAAERILGYSAAEIIGRSMTILLPPDRSEEHRILRDRVLGGEPVVHWETTQVRKNGQPIDVMVTISPIKGADGTVVGVSRIVRDISIRKQAERLRSAVSLSLSHELNTPLNGIVSVVELLQAELNDMPDDTRELVDIIRRSGRRLHRLVQRNLDFVQLEMLATGAPVPQGDGARPPAGSLVSTHAEQVAAEHQRSSDLVLEVADGVVPLGAGWLTRLLVELVDNAFKFSAPGSSVHVSSRFAAGGFELIVRDAGRGMTLDQIATVGPFIQFDRPRYE